MVEIQTEVEAALDDHHHPPSRPRDQPHQRHGAADVRLAERGDLGTRGNLRNGAAAARRRLKPLMRSPARPQAFAFPRAFGRRRRASSPWPWRPANPATPSRPRRSSRAAPPGSTPAPSTCERRAVSINIASSLRTCCATRAWRPVASPVSALRLPAAGRGGSLAGSRLQELQDGAGRRRQRELLLLADIASSCTLFAALSLAPTALRPALQPELRPSGL